MREIKFRAWNNAEKKMYPEVEDIRERYEIYLMQYTGLKDKNGQEIYEGDILKFNTKGGNEMIYEVKWRGKGFKPTRMSEDNQEEIEIIGNIYENPELLSGN